MKRIPFVLLALLLSGVACSDDSEGPKKEGESDPVTLTLSDPNATEETKALYSNLWAIQSKGFMFGHHDDLMYGRTWYGTEGGSDTKAVCGDYPAVYSFDFAEHIDDRHASDPDAQALQLRCCREAYDRGMVLTSCIHINNPLTGGDSWDNSSNRVAAEILTEGSATNRKFKEWLDRLADIAHNLRGSDGKLIPVIFRPFHEHTQTWSWWGASCTTTEEFINLWKFTVKYLRDTKGVHNFIYAISPQMDSAKTVDDFYFRWPGDEWVDFVGMDCYQGINNAVFVTNLKAISKVSLAKLKPCGVTETGVEGFTATDYWTTNIHAPLTARRVSMVVTWRNKYDPMITGKTAIVTGAARGIGKAIALKFAAEGANIAFTDLVIDENGQNTEKEIAALGVKVKGYASNAANFEDTEKVVNQIKDDFGSVDILVNNAGITKDGLMMRMSEAQWDAVIAVNLKSAFNFIHACTPIMMRQKSGSIINMASVVGVHGNAGQCNYSASKAGMIGLAKSIAQELGSRGIRANAIAPGFIITDMTAKLSDEVKAEWAKKIPLRRGGTPEDVADVATFLASDMSSYVSGQVIQVDGGMNM